ncbi:fasciclin domain-containing protein [Hyphomonas johnsonii]|jgi:uncharacterized surface protein with fasciclin (FAS1) repeats|uniref:Fasciclin domain-containing protein n=1 Tax=Hyphomonas johnsonii MHS-2 TaxID=1280950 RepID=A0A059FNU5_9PROT|nr:fasciclin domain-containing protein [Hyphomonas johnsonii]KCZ92292.1 fasciclin domain-containing protein [Hyphomonas johnsonii MHS-2]
MKPLFLTALAASALMLAACSPKPDAPSDRMANPAAETGMPGAETVPPAMTETVELPTVTDILGSSPDFTILVSAIDAAGMTNTLSGDGPFTVFAPTNEAFDGLPDGLLDELMKPENKDKLSLFVGYHVLNGKIMSKDLIGKAEAVPSINNRDMLIDATGDEIMVNTASVSMADIAAGNGVVHVIDQVLVPRFEE